MGGSSTNIAFMRVTESDAPVWFAIPDLVASFLETSSVPRILEAWLIIPKGRIETKPFDLLGDPNYPVNMNRGDDLIRCMIEMRSDLQAREKECKEAKNLKKPHAIKLPRTV